MRRWHSEYAKIAVDEGIETDIDSAIEIEEQDIQKMLRHI